MKPDNQLNNNLHPPRSFAQLIELANIPLDPNLPMKAYIQSCSLLYQRAMTSMSENNLELAFIYLLRAARSSSTYCLYYPQQGPSQRFTLKASRLSSLNSKLSGRPPSCPVSTLDSAAAEEKEDVGAPQSEVNEQVGITQYINPCLPTFSAILKHRFTNFLVYEVDNQGQVVHLKDINDPCASEESQDKIFKSKPVSLVECPVDSEVKLLEILCTSELEILKQFVSQGLPSNSKRRESKKPTTETKKSESYEKLYKQSNDGNPDNEVFRSSLFNQASHPTNREGGGTNHESDRLKIENLEKRLEDLEIVKDLRSRPEIWKEIRWLKDLETQRMQALNRDWERLLTKSSMNHRKIVQGVDQVISHLKLLKDLFHCDHMSSSCLQKEKVDMSYGFTFNQISLDGFQNQTNRIIRLINQPGMEDNCAEMSDIREFTKSIAVQDLKQAREQESAAQRLEQDAQQKTSEMQVSTTTEEATDYVLAGFKKCYYSQLRQLSHYTMAFDGQKFPLKVVAG
ncbi:hypothetical protein PPACK8108_LOCUS12975 [Phakopsora pachyrhizi]|uniref:USP8 dimerisation domain-containing protein n=1 Tax=Phakopsora pachyrhizi TaxID=170000 RepID=A0AAV0B7I6_PHAPC|nr:hypothetical protein PPACK8108_LOCUS12975 [Phakopsora pachyrhizi]